MRHFFLGIVCVLHLLSVAHAWPESRLHKKLSFKGVPLPDRMPAGNGTQFIQFGVYDGAGTWDIGKEHLKMFFKEHGFSYRLITPDDIFNGTLNREDLGVLVMPGGESADYLKQLGEPGAENIRNYVRAGGGYLGICAGAFYATSDRQGGNATGPYGIGLLKGTAYDGTALNTPPFIEGMMDFDMMPHILIHGLQKVFRIVLLGGPSFHFSAKEELRKHIDVMARYQKINEPAMMTMRYGKGRMFLSGPHIEIEEDRTDWGPEFADPDSEWPILQRVSHYLLRD